MLFVAQFIAGLAGVFICLRRQRELPAFLCSSSFIAGMLAATAAGLYPNILVSTLGAQNNLTITNAAAGAVGLRAGLIWWLFAIALAVGYFTHLFRSFRGKVDVDTDGAHY